MVGNRGVGAEAGEVLGEVPREVVKYAVCNVMVVQTGTGERAASDDEDQTLAPGGQPPDQDDQTEP